MKKTQLQKLIKAIEVRETSTNGWEEFVWDDVEFCHRARDNNYDIWVDPNIIVGHEKTVVL